ncbi:hypothetical protein BDZ45DRAFT_766719 [Acephala macrosclerotiorum]|nr:hypothetical protein BDZ45DRAFT_766719 [Acephala macrosclerotiorum]
MTRDARNITHPLFPLFKCLLTRNREPGSLVKLLIGEANPPIEIQIHKEVACQRSPVFRAAFCGNFSESQSQTYPLRHVNEPTAKLLMQWMYTGNLVVAQLKPDWKEVDGLKSTQEQRSEDQSLVDLWVLADELQMPALQNRAMKTVYDIAEKTDLLPSQSFKRLYEKTSQDSQLRKFISHYTANCLCVEFYKSVNLPTEMLIDMAMFLSAERKTKKFSKVKASDYYVKEDWFDAGVCIL